MISKENLSITVYKTVREEYYFRLRDSHDTVLLTSINYHSHTRCFEDIYVLQLHGGIDMLVELCAETSRRKYFLKLNRQRIIAESPEYVLERTLNEDMLKVVNGIAQAVMIDMSTVRFYRRVGTD